MTPGRPFSIVRKNTAEWDGQTWEVLRLFETKAEGWAAKYAPDGQLVGRRTSLSAAVSQYAQAGDRVLDVGCGTGELARALAASGFQVTGCDISPQMLLRATRDRERCAEWVQLEPDWRTLPFVSAAFDVVVAASVLEYVAEPVTVLRECVRVLRPGGVVLYTVPDLRHPVRWVEWCIQRLAVVAGEPSWDSNPSPWRRYRAYLRASRQRHLVRWWLAVSGAVGLRPASCQGDGARSALRLLAFRHADGCGGELLRSEAGTEQ